MPLYDAYEISTWLGRDVRLYTFRRGDKSWYYNNGDRDYVYNGNRYYQLAISDDGMKQKSETTTDDFTITKSYHQRINITMRTGRINFFRS